MSVVSSPYFSLFISCIFAVLYFNSKGTILCDVSMELYILIKQRLLMAETQSAS